MNVKVLVTTAMLAAVAGVLMSLEISIPFNLLKKTLNCIVGYVIYERLAKARVFERRVTKYDSKL